LRRVRLSIFTFFDLNDPKHRPGSTDKRSRARRLLAPRRAFFDDRLEIENPGLLPSGLTVEDLKRGVSKLRNRVIGRVFHAPGLIEQRGSGVQRMIVACREVGLALPRLEEIATRFRVTIYTERVSQPLVETTDQTILDELSDGEAD